MDEELDSIITFLNDNKDPLAKQPLPSQSPTA